MLLLKSFLILLCFWVGFVILIALSFLMPTFYYIPKSVLGAVIIVAVYSMIEFHEILPMWRGRSMQTFTKIQKIRHFFKLLFY